MVDAILAKVLFICFDINPRASGAPIETAVACITSFPGFWASIPMPPPAVIGVTLFLQIRLHGDAPKPTQKNCVIMLFL